MNSWDLLNNLSKPDIIEFLKTEICTIDVPKENRVLSFKWHKETERLQKRRKEHIKALCEIPCLEEQIEGKKIEKEEKRLENLFNKHTAMCS